MHREWTNPEHAGPVYLKLEVAATGAAEEPDLLLLTIGEDGASLEAVFGTVDEMRVALDEARAAIGGLDP